MSTCSNCYNGCTEIVSDRCVKYTGIDVPVLGIKTGDSLSFVEQALITFLVSTLDGTGIKIDLGSTVVCTLVNKYLPTCGDLTIVDISKALIQAACDLQVQVNAINATLTTLNADYTIGCLTGVTASSDTHAIVQAVITKVCQLGVDLQALALDLETNYVSVEDIDIYIQAYLNGIPGTTLMNTKMVPYTPIPFYPTVTFLAGKFDGTGAGIGDWDRIFLCNGQNNTPDLRGRVLVGSNAMGANSYVTPETNPSLPGNPNYAIGTTTGTNQVQLGELQMPSHTHATTVTINDPSHTHTGTAAGPYVGPNIAGGGGFDGSNSNIFRERPITLTSNPTGLKGTIAGAQHNVFVTNANTGGNQPHSNIQPSIGCYFIMYIPL
jgi:microcystin-dependent protein